jgi:hypothetical protein
MSYDDDSERNHKTGRITIFCIMIAILGGLFFAYKVDACKDKPADLTCREEFFEIREGGYDNSNKCRPGAIIEMVTSPPAPKPGIMCHCPGQPAASSPNPTR